MKTTICIEGILKESEKAICVNALVNYNANRSKAREIWMPKTLVANVSETLIDVEDWFLRKLSAQNAFHGYNMNFERPVAIKA